MTDEAKPSVLSVLQGILSALTGGAISGGGSNTTPVLPEGAATEEHQAAIIIKLNELLTELYAKANTDEAQLIQLPVSAASVAKQDEIIAQLAVLLTELAKKADVTETQPVSIVISEIQPTQALGITLNQGVSTSWDNMLSLTLVNDDASTGDITIALESVTTYLKPGESIGWDAATSSVLSTLTITVPAGTTGRMFGTRFAPIVTEGV